MTTADQRLGTAVGGVLDCIGETPLVELSAASADIDATIYGKLEFLNPSSSIKDRIYHEMITAAKERGDLTDEMEILECSTGNAGIACTLVGTQLGHDVTVVMPEGMSEERKKTIRAYGGTLIETPGGESDVDISIEKVEELQEENPGRYWFPNQFANPDNPVAHEKTTGQEIIEQLGEAPDAFVAGQGTGGTVTGVGRALRAEDESTLLYALEPAEAPLLSCAQWGSHEIEGIGDGFVPQNLDGELIDGIVAIRSEDAIERARDLSISAGALCGISSGGNVEAARRIAEETDAETLVTIITDTGMRYYSTKLFGEEPDVEIPEREHPLDDHSRSVLEAYQDDWHIIEP